MKYVTFENFELSFLFKVENVNCLLFNFSFFMLESSTFTAISYVSYAIG